MNFGAYFKLILLLLVKEACYNKIEISKCKQKIVGGQDSTATYPYMVNYFTRDTFKFFSRHFCGGTLVKSDWVLTAAHCLVTKKGQLMNPDNFRILGGTNNLKDIGDTVEYKNCKHFYYHKKYKNGKNDIGMINLVEEFRFSLVQLSSRKIVVASLASSKKTICTAMGWGAWDVAGNKYTDNLKEVSLPLMSGRKCFKYYPYRIIAQAHLCTLVKDKGACLGDSGGPLMCNGYQYGIISWGSKQCADKGHPEVYTRVDYYSKWIQATIDSSNRLMKNIYLLIAIVLQQLFVILHF